MGEGWLNSIGLSHAVDDEGMAIWETVGTPEVDEDGTLRPTTEHVFDIYGDITGFGGHIAGVFDSLEFFYAPAEIIDFATVEIKIDNDELLRSSPFEEHVEGRSYSVADGSVTYSMWEQAVQDEEEDCEGSNSCEAGYACTSGRPCFT